MKVEDAAVKYKDMLEITSNLSLNATIIHPNSVPPKSSLILEENEDNNKIIIKQKKNNLNQRATQRLIDMLGFNDPAT